MASCFFKIKVIYNMSKRVLFVLPFDHTTGAGGRKKEAIGTLIDAHEKLGYKVNCITTDYDFNVDEEIKHYALSFEYKIYAIFSRLKNVTLNKIAKRFVLISKRKLIERFHKEHPIDFILSCSLNSESNLLSYEISNKINVEYVINEHRTVFQRMLEGEDKFSSRHQKCLDNSKHIFGLTDTHRNIIQHYTSVNVSTLPLVMSNDFLESEVIENNSITISAWTNWRDIKRLDVLVDAFKLLADTYPSAKLFIAGPTPDSVTEGYALSTIDQYNLIDKVEFLGPLDRSGIRRLALKTTVCVIPSDHETFGLPVAEALCSGSPVVTTKCGGPESFIESGVNGYVTKTGDTKEISDRIVDILNNRDRFDRVRIATNARSIFSTSNLINLLDQSYKSIFKF
ncbi:hypothetical protein CWO34_12350 [Vibrio splendidus]|nr:hypothetical protein CWO34_12350 [Vibrio splendidus]